MWGFRAPYLAFCILISLFTLALFKALPSRTTANAAEEAKSTSECVKIGMDREPNVRMP